MIAHNFKDKNVVVVGLGVYGGGVGVVRFLAKEGARITVLDLKTKRQLQPQLDRLKDFKIRYVLGKKHPTSVLKKADFVIVNPAIDLRSPFIKAAKKKKIPLESEIGIFLSRCNARVIAVTGTKGKTTVAHLISSVLHRSGRKTFLGGNMGVSLLDSLPEASAEAFVVLEISSFQLDLLRETAKEFAPYIAVLTNIHKDHLDRYKNFGDYVKSKKSLFAHQSKNEYAVSHVSMKGVIGHSKARKVFFKSEPPSFIGASDICLIGKHNAENISAAAAVCDILHIGKESIRRSVQEFKGIEHRLEFVRYIGGVQYYNDSASTTPVSSTCAVETFSRPIILIAGGVNKGLSFTDFAKSVMRRTKAVYLIGKSAKEIQRSLKKGGKKLEVHIFDSLDQAVKAAYKRATIGDIVLFSPACASFDMFTNAKERGKRFKDLVEKLSK